MGEQEGTAPRESYVPGPGSSWRLGPKARVLPVSHSPPPLATFPAHLADEGGVGEGGPDVCVLVELMILGQLWGRQAEDEVAIWGGPAWRRMLLPQPLPEEMGEQNLSLLLRRAGPPLCREAEPRPGGLRGVTGAAAEVGGCTRPSGNESAAETVTLENEEEPDTGFSCEQWGRC